jgi:hypothetical protein
MLGFGIGPEIIAKCFVIMCLDGSRVALLLPVWSFFVVESKHPAAQTCQEHIRAYQAEE